MFIGKIKKHNACFIAETNYNMQCLDNCTNKQADDIILAYINMNLCYKGLVKIVKSNKYTFYIMPLDFVNYTEVKKSLNNIIECMNNVIEFYCLYNAYNERN